MSTLRLTRRGRIAKAVVTGALLALCVGVFLAVMALSLAAYLMSSKGF